LNYTRECFYSTTPHKQNQTNLFICLLDFFFVLPMNPNVTNPQNNNGNN